MKELIKTNKYEVYACNDMYLEKDGLLDWIGDFKEFEVFEKEEIDDMKKTFDNFVDAEKYFNYLSGLIERESPDTKTINSVIMIDDVSGVIKQDTVAAYKNEESIFNKYTFKVHSIDDVNFTKERMGNYFK